MLEEIWMQSTSSLTTFGALAYRTAAGAVLAWGTLAAAVTSTSAAEISLTTRSGSWLIHDWIGLETAPGWRLSEVTGMATLD
jgi:hypothetical protein